MMPGGLLRPMGPSWTVYFRVGSSGQSQEIYLGRYQMRLDDTPDCRDDGEGRTSTVKGGCM